MRLALVTLSLLSIAMLPGTIEAGEAKPGEDPRIGMVFKPDGPVTDCRQPDSASNPRMERFERQFTHFRVDQCLWQTPINQKDRTQPASVILYGTDVDCVFVETMQPAPNILEDDSMATHLRSKGLEDVKLESSLLTSIGGKPMKRQSLTARAAKEGSLRFLIWLWSDGGRFLGFMCHGPKKAVAQHVQELDAVAQSIEID